MLEHQNQSHKYRDPTSGRVSQEETDEPGFRSLVPPHLTLSSSSPTFMPCLKQAASGRHVGPLLIHLLRPRVGYAEPKVLSGWQKLMGLTAFQVFWAPKLKLTHNLAN